MAVIVVVVGDAEAVTVWWTVIVLVAAFFLDVVFVIIAVDTGQVVGLGHVVELDLTAAAEVSDAREARLRSVGRTCKSRIVKNWRISRRI